MRVVAQVGSFLPGGPRKMTESRPKVSAFKLSSNRAFAMIFPYLLENTRSSGGESNCARYIYGETRGGVKINCGIRTGRVIARPIVNGT